ncbi:MAG: adenylosuccinate lyase [Candidatus Altiarchaeota archaeon]
MSIHPIETRYGRKGVKSIFEEEVKLQKMLDVEAALARAHAAVGNIPEKDARAISRKASVKIVNIDRVSEIEKTIRHDVMAMVKALSEKCGNSGRFVHYGATSNDITDTAMALQLKEYVVFLADDLNRLRNVLKKQAKNNIKRVCVGRTHGQHAVPTTYGLKFAIWAAEVQRHIDRLNDCKQRMLVGQMTGAVGTQAAFGKHAVKIQKLTMEYLGLKPVMSSNQVIQRDRHGEFLLLLALISETLNKICTEVRNLQRTEISEVSEGFKNKQVGSSTMPHKRNPIYAERVCGLSRVVKANAFAGLDNIPMWHERDLTNSSCERIIIPESCILTDYILNLTIDVLDNLVFNDEAIQRNLRMTDGRIMAEAVMISLTERGVGRQDAHELTRECAMESFEKNKPFRDVLLKNKDVKRLITPDELDAILEPSNYIGTSIHQVERMLKELN